MNIIIHIGWHKTGSTSVQRFLFDNRKELIEKNKVYYPEEGVLHCAHHNIAYSFKNISKTPWGEIPIKTGGAERYIIDAIDSAKSKGCNTVIFSSEEFCTFKPDEIQSLHRSFNDQCNSVKIIVYIRRQDLINESAYNMEVKWWGRRLKEEFNEYIKKKENFPNYYVILSNWASAFGLSNIIVRPFELKALEKKDVRVDFFKSIGIEYENLELKEEIYNESLGPKTLEFLRILNNLDISEIQYNAIVSRLLVYDKENKSPKCFFFEPEQRINFMKGLNELNRKLEIFDINIDLLLLSEENAPVNNVRNLSFNEFNELLNYIA